MDFVVLMAGQGTRLGKINRYLQKSMYPFCGKPFVEFSLINLLKAECNVDRFIFVVGYKKEQVMDYFGSEYQGVPVEYVVQTNPKGTGHAVFLANSVFSFEEPVVVWLGDMLVTQQMFGEICSLEPDNLLSICRHVCQFKHNERVDISGNQISRAWQGNSDFVDVGLWKVSPKVIGLMLEDKTDEHRMLLGFQKAIEKGIPIGYIKTDRWIHLGGTEPSAEENIVEVAAAILEMIR